MNCDYARNPNTPPETLHLLAQEANFWVRLNVASNPNTPLKALELLAQDDSFFIRECAAKNPNATELVRRLYLMKNRGVVKISFYDVE